MAVRCVGCGRLSRDETVCEWCRMEIPLTAGHRAAAVIEAEEAAESAAPPLTPPAAAADAEPRPETPAAVPGPGTTMGEGETGRAERDEAESATTEEWVEPTPWHWDPDTRVILLLILLQFGLTLYLGRLSSWWSLTGFLWLLVGYGVVERLSWSLALPLVLVTLDVALLLFGIGPRERAGFISLAPLDFFLYLLRLVIWALIFRLRDQMD
jgi:hypothetical protein